MPDGQSLGGSRVHTGLQVSQGQSYPANSPPVATNPAKHLALASRGPHATDLANIPALTLAHSLASGLLGVAHSLHGATLHASLLACAIATDPWRFAGSGARLGLGSADFPDLLDSPCDSKTPRTWDTKLSDRTGALGNTIAFMCQKQRARNCSRHYAGWE